MLTDAGHDAVALEGAKSQYDVVADGELVFSKQHEGRFPEDDEVLAPWVSLTPACAGWSSPDERHLGRTTRCANATLVERAST